MLSKDKSKINKTIGIRLDVWEAIVKNDISNFSEFVNDLLYDTLMDRDIKKQYLVKRLTEIQNDLAQMKLILEFSIREQDQTDD